MMDESVLPTSQWMDMMAFSMLPDDLARISSNEKTKQVLSRLITCVRPKETVRKAKHILLTRKQKNQEKCKNLELMRKRNKLKEQLWHKEEELADRKKEFIQFLKENKNLLQEIQWSMSILNDEKKKLFFLLLNEKTLNDTTMQYHLLRKSVHEAKEKENRKRENHCSSEDPDKAREAVHECQAYIMSKRKKQEVQAENKDNITTPCGCNSSNTEALEWKHDAIEFVTKKLDNISLNRVFEVILEQKQQIINSVKLLSNRTNPDAALITSKTCNGIQEKSHIEALESIFVMSNYAELTGLIEIKSESDMKSFENECRASLSRSSEDSVSSQVIEDLKMSESNLLSIENHIAEKAVECKDLKINLKTNLVEVLRRLSGIKRFCRRIQRSGRLCFPEEDPQSVLQMNELFSCMEELCKLGPKEIQLFATLPLIALEKLSMENGKCVPVYELHSHYLRVLSSTSECFKSTLSVVKDASGLAPHYLLLHVWKQLNYLGELQKAHSLMKPFPVSSANLRVGPEDSSEKLELIHDNFLRIISQFASMTDDIGTLLEIMKHHPLTAVVPKDLLVEGQSIQFYIEWFNKAKENKNNFSDITEEHVEN